MTRATLLHVLDSPTALGPAEVRELEQLAQAFPYCQTAHLLLAKAAHDQGTMLAGQRLRRAATYAADRALLRRLIEQVEPAAAEMEPASLPDGPAENTAESNASSNGAFSAIAATVPETSFSPAVAPAPAPVPELPQLLEVERSPEPEATLAQPAPAPTIPETVLPVLVEESTPALQSETVIEGVPQQLLEAEPIPEYVVVPVDTSVVTEPEVANDSATAAEQPAAGVVTDAEGSETSASSLPTPTSSTETTDALLLLVDRTDSDVVALETGAELQPTEESETVVEVDLPAQAPAIRPPVEVGEARFEFGLAETPAPSKPSYELPGLVDEWAASAVTRSLGNLAASTESFPTEAPVALTPAAFTGDPVVGYALGESSRLGFAMQLLDYLTNRAETTEWPSDLAATAWPTSEALPPIGSFFEPDLLVQHHWAAHCPPAPVLPSSLDLINNFLRRQPRLTRPAMLPPAASHQADLSVRSTRAEPDLVSENLARIFVRQGKLGRAVEIYEKLMVKQPEKMAYFAAQIQQLQPSA